MYILNPAGRRPISPAAAPRSRTRSPARKHRGDHRGSASSVARSSGTSADIAALTKVVQSLADVTATTAHQVAAASAASGAASGAASAGALPKARRAIGAPAGAQNMGATEIISLHEQTVAVPVSSLRLLASSLGEVREHVEKLTVLLPVIASAENAMRSLSS